MNYKILPVGDSALTIIFGTEIDPEISRIVRIARKYLTEKRIKGVSEYVQTYAALMVHYNPLLIGFDDLTARIDEELSRMDPGNEHMKKRTIVIPVCYGGEYGEILYDFGTEGKGTLLIIANSYSNPINALIASHFDRTVVVDPRYWEQAAGTPFDPRACAESAGADTVLLLGDIQLFTGGEGDG